MISDVEEYSVPFRKGKKLVDKLKEAGYVLVEKKHGQSVFVNHANDGQPKMLGHYLPAAFIGDLYFKLVNRDEPSFKETHEELRKIYHSVVV